MVSSNRRRLSFHDFLIDAVVKIKMFEMLEFEPGRRKQFLGDLDMPIHRAAHIEKQQYLHGIAALRPQLHVEIALLGGLMDRAVEIEFFDGARTGKAAKPPAAPPACCARPVPRCRRSP